MPLCSTYVCSRENWRRSITSSILKPIRSTSPSNLCKYNLMRLSAAGPIGILGDMFSISKLAMNVMLAGFILDSLWRYSCLLMMRYLSFGRICPNILLTIRSAL